MLWLNVIMCVCFSFMWMSVLLAATHLLTSKTYGSLLIKSSVTYALMWVCV